MRTGPDGSEELLHGARIAYRPVDSGREPGVRQARWRTGSVWSPDPARPYHGPVVVACPGGSPPDLAARPRRSSCPDPSSSQGPAPPIGKLSGALAGFTAIDLGGFAIAGALERAGVAPDQVDYVFMGQVILAGPGPDHRPPGRRQGRHPDDACPATTVNKVCLSGLNTIYLADLMIHAGEADIVVAGGMESMTQAPYLLPGARAGYRIGDADRGRLDDVRRALLRLRPLRHGSRHRAVQRGRRGVPGAPGRLQRRSPTSGRPPPSRTASSPTRSSR